MLSDKHRVALPFLNKKFNLGLDIGEKVVYRNGVMMNPFDIVTLFEAAFKQAREEFLDGLFLESLAEKPKRVRKKDDNS